LNWWQALIKPKQIVDNINEVDFKKLRQMGIKALILDIDDTLLPRQSNDITPELFSWVMARKAEGFKLCLTSNSRHPARVEYIGQTLGLPAMAFGFKPLPFAFWQSLKILNTTAQETTMIGDQLFMDILGANLVGIHTIFVRHLTPETFLPRIWMRQAEEWALKRI
jgi:HAD superfamily phosphatase (TIGR01668 family)